MAINLHPTPSPVYPNGTHRDNFTFSVNNKLGSVKKQMVIDLSGDADLNMSGGTQQPSKYSTRIVGVWTEI
jgi:hypothetical protein